MVPLILEKAHRPATQAPQAARLKTGVTAR